MHLFYDETKDQSEKFGWKKVCDEHVPTEEEQIHWGNLTIAFACILSLIAISL